MERAKDPDSYIALASMTGANEVWYVSPIASHAALGARMKRQAENSTLSAEVERLTRGDAEFVSSVRSIHAVARPDLSMGEFPDVAKMRFWEITIFRVRPGHEPQFEAAAKAYMSSAKRAAPNNRFRTYEVIAGMAGPTYLVFGSVADFGDLDKTMAEGIATMSGVNAEEGAALQKLALEAAINTETQRFRLDPMQSYVSKEVKASDPAF